MQTRHNFFVSWYRSVGKCHHQSIMELHQGCAPSHQVDIFRLRSCLFIKALSKLDEKLVTKIIRLTTPFHHSHKRPLHYRASLPRNGSPRPLYTVIATSPHQAGGSMACQHATKSPRVDAPSLQGWFTPKNQRQDSNTLLTLFIGLGAGYMKPQTGMSLGVSPEYSSSGLLLYRLVISLHDQLHYVWVQDMPHHYVKTSNR